MGLSPFRRSSCSCDHGYAADVADVSQKPEPSPAPRPPADPRFGNPNPKRFEIRRYLECGSGSMKRTVVEVSYPDAKNYEGRKVMLYLCAHEEVARQESLDPHFCDDGGHLSPFARFEPTKRGWAAAVKLAQEV